MMYNGNFTLLYVLHTMMSLEKKIQCPFYLIQKNIHVGQN